MKLNAPLILGCFSTLVFVTPLGCGPVDCPDDDPCDNTDSPTTPTMTPGPVTISGQITARDVTTGQIVDEEAYISCFGDIAVYLLSDPSDVQNPIEKRIMRSPADYEFIVDPNSGPYYITVVADTWHDSILGYRDALAEYAYNPINTGVENQGHSDVALNVTLCDGGCCGGGGGGTYTYSHFTGNILLDPTTAPAPVMVTANDNNFLGPYSANLIVEPGTWSFNINESYLDSTNVIAYMDVDGNSLFEPSDLIGVPENNPYSVGGEASYEGVDIQMGPDSVTLDSPPLPIYLPISGTVTYDGDDAGLTFLYLSSSAPQGPIVSSAVIPEPGNWLMRTPQRTSNLWVWGVVDTDGDGRGDPNSEPWGKTGPITVGIDGIYGIELNISADGTPTPEASPTNSPTAEPTPPATAEPQTPQPTDPVSTPEATVADITVAPTVVPATQDNSTPASATTSAEAPTPTEVPPTSAAPTDAPAQSRISGVVKWTGAVGEGDVLVLALQTAFDDPDQDYALTLIPVSPGDFPYSYMVENLTAGTYSVFAYLDHGGDNPDGPEQGEPSGFYTGLEGQGPSVDFYLAPQSEMSSIDFTLYE